MFKSVDVDFIGEQGAVSKPRLQCIVDECDGFRNDDLSSGVHVSCYSVVANVHEVKHEKNLFSG